MYLLVRPACWSVAAVHGCGDGGFLLTATPCAGDPAIVNTTSVFANLEAREASLDFGHRCGAPISTVSSPAAAGTPLAMGSTAWLPLYLSISPTLYMKSVSAVVTYDISKLRVVAVRSPDEAADASAGGSAGFYDSFTLNDAAFTVNYGDTNAVTVTIVWPEPQQLLQQVTAIALLHVEVLALPCHVLWPPVKHPGGCMSCALLCFVLMHRCNDG